MDIEIQLLNTNYKIIDNFLDKDFYQTDVYKRIVINFNYF